MRARSAVARLGALALVASVMLGGAACSLVAGLDKLTFDDAAGCTGPCDDLDPCTEGDCLTATGCHGTAAPDGPAPGDPTGNCQTIACVAGVAKTTADPTDVPADDGNACTAEACTDGAPAHPAKPDGDACTLGQSGLAGVCNAGACAATCTASAGCDDLNPCTTEACDPAKSICVTTLLADGTKTPGAVSMPGNCHTHVCLGGVDTDAPDDVDVIPSPNECVTATCTAGALTMPPAPLGTPCTYGGGQVCDGAGACVACNVSADCAPTGDDCKLATCKADKSCGTMFAPYGTQLSTPLQTKGNCHTLYCDAVGGTFDQINNSDVPDDGNPCTVDTCTSGVPSHVPGPVGVDCGVGQKCNVAGKCGCVDDTQCVAPDSCGGGNPGTTFTCGCTKTTCAAAGATCGQISDGCYATLMCNSGTKNGAETDIDCGGGGGCATTCGAGKLCKIDGDCASGHCADGVCCNAACAGACMACNLTGSLGTCANVAAGASDPVTCVAPSTCDGAGACKKPNGTTCVAGTACSSGLCVDGVCCNSTCTATCMSCNNGTTPGTCSNLASGKTDTNATTTCVAPSACDGAGNCKKTTGTTCSVSTACLSGFCVDGVCCGSACAGTCTACNVTGSLGVCTNIPTGQPDTSPANTCTTTSLCNGAGVCKLAPGQPCTAGTQCLSGGCTANVCL
jgi:hypothetical protein